VDKNTGTSWIDVAQVVAATAGILIAALVAFMPFVRRPRLSVEEDEERVASRVERITGVGLLPHVRLLVANRKWRRAAQETRVFVEWYREQDGESRVSLGHPPLFWPSVPEEEATGGVVVFAGGRRPVGLGTLIRVRLSKSGRIERPPAWTQGLSASVSLTESKSPHIPEGGADGWYLFLAELDINDDRDKLPPVENGYTIRLLVGADDGAARAYEVDISWDGDPKQTPDEVLASALDHLGVREV
jgi:hypothetical protein